MNNESILIGKISFQLKIDGDFMYFLADAAAVAVSFYFYII